MSSSDGGGGGGGGSIPDATLFTTRVILICMKMGSDESHFGVSLLSWAPRP